MTVWAVVQFRIYNDSSSPDICLGTVAVYKTETAAWIRANEEFNPRYLSDEAIVCEVHKTELIDS